MKRLNLFLVFLLLATPAFCSEEVKSIKIAVENPTNVTRFAADVILSIPDLRKIAPDFMPGSLLVSCTSGATLKEDASAASSTELPSQVDDLDGDGKADELVFQIDLAPRQTRVVTIRYGEPDKIWRLRKDYPMRTNALFSPKIEGLGWESENIAFRVYFDPRNAIDIYGKRRRTLQLGLYASPEYPYHEESPEGRDIFKVGDSIGIGGLAAWVDGKLVKAADVKERKWRITSLGPVRTIVELEYRGWNLDGKSITVRSRIAQWAGEHGFYQSIETDPQFAAAFVTGFPIKHGIDLLKSISANLGDAAWIATWGEQVVAPGATATEAIPGQNLGLAVLMADSPVEFVDDHANHLLKFEPRAGKATWFALAGWDQENTEGNKSSGNKSNADRHQIEPRFSETSMNKEVFFSIVRNQALRMAQPTKIHILADATNK